MKIGAQLLLAGMLALWPASAHAQALVADLTSHLIAITTGFTGTEVVLFGAVEGDGDVVVVVRGPEAAVTVRRKESVLGIWLNQSAVTFAAVPQYYAVAATRPLSAITSADTLRRQQIGVEHVTLNARGRPTEDLLAAFRPALIDGKITAGLWQRPVGPVTYVGGRLFRTTISLPANVPTGRYQVTTYLFRRGEVVAAQATPLLVSQLGTSAEIAGFAHRDSLLYGSVAVLLAMVAGWGASVLFRRT